jgi:hypothetical protein
MALSRMTLRVTRYAEELEDLLVQYNELIV